MNIDRQRRSVHSSPIGEVAIFHDLPKSEEFLDRVGSVPKKQAPHPLPPHPPPFPSATHRKLAIHFVTTADVRAFQDIQRLHRLIIDEMPMDVDELVQQI